MRRLLPRTILGQLIAGTVLMQAVLLVLFLCLTVRRELNEADTRNALRLEGQAMLLAHLVQRPLEMRDAEQTQSLVEAVRASPSINSARITDIHGNTLALSPADAGELDSHELPELNAALAQYHSFRGENGEFEGMAPVISDGRVIALAWIEPDPKTLNRQPKSLIQNAMLYGLLALLTNVLLVSLLARTISRPLTTLVAGTKELVRDPEHSEVFPLPVTTFNEAGDLTQSFNATVLELRRQRAGLRETLAMLDSMLATAPVGFAFFDLGLRFVRVNQYVASLNASPILHHIGRHLSEMVDSDLETRIASGVMHCFETGEALHEVEVSGEAKDQPGVPRSWSISFYPVYAEEQEVRWVGVVVMETTQRRRSEEMMRRSEKLAAAGRLAASIAHEINNPLEAVTNLIYLLRGQASLDAEAREYADLAQNELARVSQITQQTLRFYRQSTQPTRVNMAEILDSVLLLHNARIQGANIGMACEYAPDTEIKAFGGELRQLFANLIGNAVDAMPAGGRLRIAVKRAHGWRDGGVVPGVRVTVADNGTGMTPEVSSHIFEPFYTTKEATGTGLGLWVSQEIVRKHGGTLHVRSRTEAPSGTVFTVFFPQDGVA